MKQPLRLAALCLCAALALAGCRPAAPLPSGSEPPAPTPTAAPGSIRFSLGYDPSASLHPITGDSQVNRDLTGLVYQGLYELDNTFTPRPVLAKSAAVSEDGLTWTFTLDGGARFSDGTPLTAQHAAASLNTARASKLYAARLADVTGAAAAEDGTLAVSLSVPNGSLPALLDIPVVLELEDVPAPLGTGYYQYEQVGDGLSLRTNPLHPACAALPYSAIPLTAVSGADQRIAAFDSGEVTAVTTDFSSAYALGYASSFEAWDYPTTSLLYVGFQTASGPCRSALVRRAFSRACDRDELVRLDLSGHGDAAALPASPLCGDYDGEAAAQLGYDPEAAAQLLRDAGYSAKGEDGLLYSGRSPLAVTLVVNSDNDARQAAAGRIADALTGLGVSVKVERLPWNDYTAALAAGRFDLYIGEVQLTGDFDPGALLAGELNYGGFDSEALALALSGWKAARGTDRAQAAQALWGQFVQDAPIAPLCFKRGSMLVRWGIASNLQPTRANPCYRMEQWVTTGRP